MYENMYIEKLLNILTNPSYKTIDENRKETVIDESFNPNISTVTVINKFDITTSAAEWSLIKPKKVVYGDSKKYFEI